MGKFSRYRKMSNCSSCSSHFRPHQTPKCRWILHFVMPHTKMKKMQSLNCCYYRSNTCAHLQKSLCSLQSACRREIEVGDWFEVDQQKLWSWETEDGMQQQPSFSFFSLWKREKFGTGESKLTILLCCMLFWAQFNWQSMPFNWD